MMAVGQWTFGLTPFGWRFSVALIGTVSILMIARIARRMTGSTMLGCVAGLLLALDGLELVLSRTAILDIFVMFWVLAAFGLLVIDRDQTMARLAGRRRGRGLPDSRAEARHPLAAGGRGPLPGRGVREQVERRLVPARLRRPGDRLGSGRPAGGRLPRLAGRRPAQRRQVAAGLVRAAPLVIYTASWTGWFATSDGYDRNWAAAARQPHPDLVDHRLLVPVQPLDAAVRPRPDHRQSYKSNPLGWLVLARPISFYWCCGTGAELRRTPNAQEVLAIGTPLIWWGGTLALLFCLGWWLLGLIGDLVFSRMPRRDWRAGAVLLGVAAGWLPWIWYAWHDNRTEFYYYAVAFDPFLIIAITLCLGLIIGPARAAPGRRAVGAVAAGGYLVAVLLNLAYLYPVLTAQVIPYSSWLSRMWFHRWI